MKKQDTSIQIQVLGAAGTVTGSKYLIRTSEKTILVDCGMFQGLKNLRLLNWEPFTVNPATVDLVLLTHGHLDHTGYLPRLVQGGFSGPIYGSAPTLEVAKIILEDSAKIQEEDADRAREKKYSKHKKPKPLYGMTDVKATLPLFAPQLLDTWIALSTHIACRFRYNSHIIGATFIELQIFDKTFVFSGDIGRDDDPLMYPPQLPETADILFIESTYGNRLHPDRAKENLAALIKESASKRGTIIIPSFAVERTQMLMYLLWQLKLDGQIPDIPVYMDSPMGTNVLEVFLHRPQWHKLTAHECQEMCKGINLIQSVEETYHVMASPIPKIVIAGSGMATGGRVLLYFRKYLGDTSATILLVGYQAEGTRGRLLLEGAPEIKLHGSYYPVRATIANAEGLSAHADQTGLLNWLKKLEKVPERIFIVHGEPQASDALRLKIKDTYGWESEVPFLNAVIQVDGNSHQNKPPPTVHGDQGVQFR
jgi:metallo-beta-lactamase family protein